MDESQHGLSWRKSSFSNGSGGNNCVEVAHYETNGVERILIRNSKYPTQVACVFSRPEWDAFLSGVHAGEFNDIR